MDLSLADKEQSWLAAARASVGAIASIKSHPIVLRPESRFLAALGGEVKER
jgi:hypothetical protein